MAPDVFAPARLGPVTLRNRTVKAATFEGRTPDGQVTDGLIDYHLAVAQGGVGLTTVAYLAIAPEGRTHREQIVVGPDTEKGLARLAEAIHQTGAKVAGQVGHAGPVANGRSNGVHALSASRMPSPLSMQMVRAASEQDLTRITAAYVDTARTLVRAGFDVLELHMAHSYLISSFLAPGLNRRKDRYGGRLENRARLARQVARRGPRGGRLLGGRHRQDQCQRRLPRRRDHRREPRRRGDARGRPPPRRAAAQRRQLADEPDVPLPRRDADQGVRRRDAAAGAAGA